MIFTLSLIVTGLVCGYLLFIHFPFLSETYSKKKLSNLTIIIPARNEQENLLGILRDLKQQTVEISEIICVNDCSSDNTAEIASSNGAKVINIENKPCEWIGKSWACFEGAQASKSEVILFLDADVRLAPSAIEKLLCEYTKNRCPISVQPFHTVVKPYEQFSLFFNLIEIGANGVTTAIKGKNAGLFGPVIMIDRLTYFSIGGHKSVRTSIVDDIDMGRVLNEKNIKYKLFLGNRDICFRMYGNGLRSLAQGWTKNYATGAAKTPLSLFFLTFLWLSSLICLSIYPVYTFFTADYYAFAIYFLIYTVAVAHLLKITEKIGSFAKMSIVLFPVQLLFFLYIFFVSVLKKILRREVIWKGRKIKLEK